MQKWQKLIEGFSLFRRDAYDGRSALMPRLMAEGQNPDYFIISCIDSRSNPGTVFRAPPGTFFSHKAMGAIVRPYQQGTALAAALQFALNYNNVKRIIILGHTGCGAIKALVEEMEDDEIASFVAVARAGLERARARWADEAHHDDLFRHAEEQIVLLSTENLKTYPSVKTALDQGRLEIASWLFDMHAGALYSYNTASGGFEVLTPGAAAA